MKQLGFALIVAASLIATPAIAQMSGTTGADLIDAVKKRDGDKTMQVLQGQSPGIIDSKDEDGNTSLLIAIDRSDEQWTGFLLNRGADPNLAGKGGDTPLIAAARVGFDQAMEWLLGLGAKVDSSNRMGETALIIAVQQRDLPAVRMLLKHGANPDKADAAAGFSARDYARRDPRAREILALINEAKPTATSAAK